MIEAIAERLEGAPRQLRRRWSDEFKAQVVAEALEPGGSVSGIAHRIGIHPSQLVACVAMLGPNELTCRGLRVAKPPWRASVCRRRAARLHDCTMKSCDGSAENRNDRNQDSGLSATLARIDGELAEALATTRQIVEADRPSSIRAEDINRFVLAALNNGRLHVQATEIAKALRGSASASAQR
nr:transposase [Bradyrhizobium lablabi]